MGDCNLSLSYNVPKSDEKLCKYTYCSWCPTCDRESPRRRTKSETNEPCKRRGKEMKSPMSKKYDRCYEYENMDLEYDTKDNRYDCCRIRTNLCELPTTYITNNYQNLSNLTIMSNGTSDFMECIEKSVKNYEQTLKLADLNNQMQNMSDKQKLLLKVEDVQNLNTPVQKVSPNRNTNGISLYEKGISPSRNGVAKAKLPNGVLTHTLSPSQNEMYNLELRNKHHHIYSASENRFSYSDGRLPHTDRRNTGSSDFRLMRPNTADFHEKGNICFDTCTFFDKKFDTANLHERYTKEIELLRNKLRELKGANYGDVATKQNHSAPPPPTARDKCKSPPQVKLKTTTIQPRETVKQQPTIVNKVEEKKTTADSDVKKIKPLAIKREPPKSASKISLKTRSKVNVVKLRKIRSKIAHSVSTSDASDSECSGSDENDKGECLEEETPSVSECSVKETVPLKPATPITIIHQPEGGDSANWPLRPSLFPNIPPYLRFNTHDAAIPYKLPNGRRYLKWKLSTITPIVVRKTLTNTGFRLVRSEFSRESNEWLGTWGKHMKSPMFKTLKETQKLNHFPGTFQIGRKDRLWRNFQRLINKFGCKEFGFIPQTYVLPQDLKLLKQNWEYKNGSGDEKWIIKPPASARGVGIRVINRWCQLPKRMSLVVQKYISNPYLINGSKFDLRLYVLVTSFNPLRIYLYPDGLARFASAKYSDDVKDLKDRYMHLTNYSINKLSSQYTANEDANACQGHKWTISKLWEFMGKQGIDTKSLWKNLEQLVVKTIISGESAITQLCQENMNSRYSCYELFGIDVLLDEDLKPWLLEVNISPSLHSASPLDLHVKGPLVKALFDMAQFHLPPRLVRLDNNAPCYEPKIYTTALTKKERTKHVHYTQLETREEYLADILDDLTGDDIRHLTQAEDELTVTGQFVRVFPTAYSHTYLQFMEPRYYNRLFDAWECQFDRNRKPGIKLLQSLCAQKMHLKVATSSTIQKNSPNTNSEEPSANRTTEEQVHFAVVALKEESVQMQKAVECTAAPIKQLMQEHAYGRNLVIKPFPRTYRHT